MIWRRSETTRPPVGAATIQPPAVIARGGRRGPALLIDFNTAVTNIIGVFNEGLLVLPEQ